MSTGLIRTYERNEIAILNPNSEAAIAMKANMEGEEFSEQDFIRVKTPSSGGTIWNVPLISGVQAIGEIEGIIVFKGYKGLIWPYPEQRKNANGKKDRPVVVSNDLEWGKLMVPREEVPPEMMEVLDANEKEGMPGVYDWKNLPYCQWGTGKEGNGKYAKEHQLLFILRKDEALPLFIQVGAGSLKDMRQFFKRMSDVPYHRAIVSLTLKEAPSLSGITYSKIVPKMVGKIDAESGDAIEKMFKERLKKNHEAGLIDVAEDSPED